MHKVKFNFTLNNINVYLIFNSCSTFCHRKLEEEKYSRYIVTSSFTSSIYFLHLSVEMFIYSGECSDEEEYMYVAWVRGYCSISHELHFAVYHIWNHHLFQCVDECSFNCDDM